MDEKGIFVTRCSLDALDQKPITWLRGLIGYRLGNLSTSSWWLQLLGQAVGAEAQERREARREKTSEYQSMVFLHLCIKFNQVPYSLWSQSIVKLVTSVTSITS